MPEIQILPVGPMHSTESPTMLGTKVLEKIEKFENC